MEHVSSVWLWRNGMVMVFGDDGEQISELQGEVNAGRLEEIRRSSTPATGWFGFGEDGPLSWPTSARPDRLR